MNFRGKYENYVIIDTQKSTKIIGALIIIQKFTCKLCHSQYQTTQKFND